MRPNEGEKKEWKKDRGRERNEGPTRYDVQTEGEEGVKNSFCRQTVPSDAIRLALEREKRPHSPVPAIQPVFPYLALNLLCPLV